MNRFQNLVWFVAKTNDHLSVFFLRIRNNFVVVLGWLHAGPMTKSHTAICWRQRKMTSTNVWHQTFLVSKYFWQQIWPQKKLKKVWCQNNCWCQSNFTSYDSWRQFFVRASPSAYVSAQSKCFPPLAFFEPTRQVQAVCFLLFFSLKTCIASKGF